MNSVLLRRVRMLLGFFMLALLASGLTAIPLQWELGLLDKWVAANGLVREVWPSLARWIGSVHEGVQNGYGQYPFLAYGTDWLAFGHIAIVVAFFGPLRDPIRNLWVIEFGMIACVLVIPWALAFGALRGIPLAWRIIDMSFGILGIIPLWLARRTIQHAQREP